MNTLSHSPAWTALEVHHASAANLEMIVSLLDADEVDELDLRRECELCEARGITFVSFSIADRSVPADKPATIELSRQISTALSAGTNVAVHCRAGIGRSALVAASALICGGVDAHSNENVLCCSVIVARSP